MFTDANMYEASLAQRKG